MTNRAAFGVGSALGLILVAVSFARTLTRARRAGYL